jgi:hypothetical protein
MWSNSGRDHLGKRFSDEGNNLSSNSNTFMHRNTSTLERLDRTKHTSNMLPSKAHKQVWVQFNLFTIFNMMQDALFVLTRQSSQNSKLAPVAWHIHVSPYNN